MRVALNLEQCFQRPPGGIGRYASELARVLPGAGAPGEVVVVPFVARHAPATVRSVLAAAGVTAEAVALGLPRPVLYEAWNRWGRADPLRGHGSLALRDVDVVHAPSVAVPPRRFAPLVVTVHDAAPLRFPDTYPRRGRRFHELGFAAAAARADAVVAPSVAAADEVAEFTAIERSRIHPIHHGVDHTAASADDVARVRVALGLDPDEPYVAWVGTLEPRKDVATLVEAFARAVVARGLPHRLVLVGPPGWLAGADAAARAAAPLGDRVTFTGPVPADHLRAVHAGADVFALPSRHEGFGMPVLEAMAQGTAVVASDLAVLREVGGDTVRYAPVGDPGAWAEVLAALLDDAPTRTALGDAARARAATFTWERSAAEHLAVYRSVA
ncbi:MAG: glycosyltransferase family 1 protein [Actinomycetes bacterium]